MKGLLEIRKELKERKPEFIRQDTQKRKKLSLKWKKPKGIHSKMRHNFKGKRKSPSPGYKSPSKVRGLHASGLRIVNVHSAGDVDNIKKDTDGIVVSSRVGMKKKYEILKKAKQLGISVLNINADDRIKKIEVFLSSKKNGKKESKKEPKDKDQAKEEGHKEKEQEQKLFEEDKKEAEKREKDKLLTRKA
jgi:large subunit ribosomal protein L32e